MSTSIHNEKPIEGWIHEKDAQVGTTEEVQIDPVAEKKVRTISLAKGITLTSRKLIRKLDLMLSPMMVIIFLVAYLDRSNIGTLCARV